MSDELWLGIRWLHLLALAFFVGGQLMLAAVVVPVAKGTRALHALEGAIFLVSLAIVWLGVSLAHG